uniref:GTP-binding protein/GTPase n=1 Tax=Nephromyces sp. MMRI TaxID=2496275 RepID=A0A3Q8UC84_9APIC|nr:GTP-binding protein/GTPase [Nephromyces sp. MMRI]
MESLIPLMNQIHKIFGYENMNNQLLDLPQIAVVGAQSVGKTSVIESLVKRDILPRGTGFVTRRPLMIQLNHVNEKQEYAEFNHLPGTKLIDLIGVKEEIERETERTVGKNNISSEIIYLNIFSSKVINLTLIDLPGIIKVPVQDQPQDIEIQIKNIILQFISKQNCIILALTAGNTDIANSDSLKLARDVDPSGTRTIGVITKCDTIEDGFDALDSILGKLYPLKLGYIGVVCRNQKQTLEKKSIEDSLKYEDYFFSNHPKYSRVKGGYGIPNLADKLNKFLVSSILNSIPEIKSRITNLLFETENELKFYEQPFQSEEDSGALLLNIFTHFSKYFEEAIDGKLSNQPSEELYGGARINFIFHDWYSKVLNDYNLDYAVSDTEILTTLRNASGINSTLFFPYPAFEILVKKQILLLETPSLKCVEQVYLELKNIVNECDLSAMKRFTHLKESIFTVVNNALERLLAPTNKMIHNIIQMQTAYINTNHPEFLAVKSLITSFNSENSNSQIQSDIENISPNIDSHLKQKNYKTL